MRSTPSQGIFKVDLPPDLNWAVSTVGFRHEVVGQSPVLHLPELRPSIQLFSGAPYWVREIDVSSQWTQIPKAGLWGPRYQPAYGWCGGEVSVVGIALTAAGFQTLFGQMPSAYVNQVVLLNIALEQELGIMDVDITLAIETRANLIFDAMRRVLSDKTVKCEQQTKSISSRHARRQFVDTWGIAPKRRERLERLDLFIRSLHQTPWESPGSEPPELRFADQPHIIRECKALTGLTPKQIALALRNSGRAAIRSIPMPNVCPPSLEI